MNTCIKCGGTEGLMLVGKNGHYHMKPCVAPAATVVAATSVQEKPEPTPDMPILCPECKKWQMEPPLGYNNLRRESGKFVFPRLRCGVCSYYWLERKHGRGWTDTKEAQDVLEIIKKAEALYG